MPPVKQAPEKPEVEVKPSAVQLIATLDVGKSHSIAERLNGDEATKQIITETRERMRNVVASAVARARAQSGGKFTIESGEITTRSLDILCVVVITRTE